MKEVRGRKRERERERERERGVKREGDVWCRDISCKDDSLKNVSSVKIYFCHAREKKREAMRRGEEKISPPHVRMPMHARR